MRNSTVNLSEGNVGFQIAPMIDVVFVIMLFFMVMAGAVKTEKEINTLLPGPPDIHATFADETVIAISSNGEVTLNDQPYDTTEGHDLPDLKATLMRLKQSSDASHSPALVTIVSDPDAKYSRTVDVLDALAAAKIENVTFSVAESGE